MQLRRGSCWVAAVPAAPPKQIRDLFPSVALPLSLRREGRLFQTGRRKHQGRSVVVVYRTGKLWASPAAGWWDVKEGLAALRLCKPDAITLLRADAAPTPEHLLELREQCLRRQ